MIHSDVQALLCLIFQGEKEGSQQEDEENVVISVAGKEKSERVKEVQPVVPADH